MVCRVNFWDQANECYHKLQYILGTTSCEVLPLSLVEWGGLIGHTRENYGITATFSLLQVCLFAFSWLHMLQVFNPDFPVLATYLLSPLLNILTYNDSQSSITKQHLFRTVMMKLIQYNLLNYTCSPVRNYIILSPFNPLGVNAPYPTMTMYKVRKI